MTIKKFQKTIWDHYRSHKRDLPWRKTTNIYRIWVSEVMLQQTQVSRVVTKYRAFLRRFPTVAALAHASMKDVLLEWQGLGYNRRGLNLWRAAQTVMKDYKGRIPTDPDVLEQLPGIGHYTARAIVTFSKNRPFSFIETNIRSVYIHSFFSTRKAAVHDRELLPYIERTLDQKHPREWYWALMDYGALLKKSTEGINARSQSYRPQSAFRGSKREVRSAILKYMLAHPKSTERTLMNSLPFDKAMIAQSIEALIKEKFIIRKNKAITLHS